jgi:hypothetical protein
MDKFNKVILFNLWHNGDLHCGRSFVNYTYNYVKSLGLECEHYQNVPLNLYKDLGIPCKTPINVEHRTPCFIKDNILYLNTWFAIDMTIYNKYGVSFDTLYEHFTNIFKVYFDKDISTEDLWTFFPEIDYNKFNIENAKKFLNTNKDRKKIFISNGTVHSAQSINFSFSDIINSLANKYPEYLFLLSNEDSYIKNSENIHFTKNIINSNECDLNENSYLSTECDIIIGRHSSPYMFAITKYNYNRNVKFIDFCIRENFYWIVNLPMTYKATIIGSREMNPMLIFKIIGNNI